MEDEVEEQKPNVVFVDRIEVLGEDKDEPKKPQPTIDPKLLAEIVAELGLQDPTLLAEVVSEFIGDTTEADKLMKELQESARKILTLENGFAIKNGTHPLNFKYETGKFQKVNITPKENELIYELIEPKLSAREEEKLKFIENVFDKLIGLEETAALHDAESRHHYLRQKFEELVRLYGIRLKEEEKERLYYYIERNFLKFGKIDVMMNDKFIEDISCNGPNQYLYIYHREHGSIRTNIKFDEKELNEFILRLSQLCGKHISILNPIMDASLPDGSRINMTLGSEVTKKGSSFTIRKFKKVPISPIELMAYGSVNEDILAYVWMLLDYGMSILVSGGTASGKTTLLNAICMFIKPQLKIVSIEDTPEINIEHPNWLQSVARWGFGAQGGGVSGISGISGMGGMTGAAGASKSRGEIGLYDLLVAALRQRPDYIIVGEVRGSEAFTMFQAIAVGHACLGTIHARSMNELIGRVESVPMNVPRTLFSNVDLVLFVSQIKSGDRIFRRVIEAVEVLELEADTKALITNPLFKWNAKDDSFDRVGRFMLFDRIAGEFGIPVKSLLEEHERRMSFIADLKNKKIMDHIEVTRKVVEYYRRADRLRVEYANKIPPNGAPNSS